MLRKNDYLLISILTLLTFIVLYLFRTLDDNRLISWQWAFAYADGIKIFFILILGIIFAFVVSNVSFPERNPVIFLFLSSFVIAMFFWREPELIVDTSRYFTQAKHLSFFGIGYFFKEWGRDISAWTDMPLIPFLYGLIFKFFGESRTYIQIFTTSLFSMTIVVTYLIGKTLWNKDVGFSAGLLLLGIPYLLPQVPLMLTDVPTMFFLTFSIFTFIKAIERGRIWIVVSSFAIFLTFFSKYSTWLMLSVLVVIFLVFKTQDSKPAYRAGRLKTQNYIYCGIITLLISAFLIGIVILLKFDVLSEQIKLLLDYQRAGLRRWGEGFISTFLFQTHPFITAAAIYSAYAAFKKKDLKYLIIIWLIFLVMTLQIKRIRYIIMTFPMFAMMASYGLQEIKDRRIVRFISLCIVVFSVVVAVFGYFPFLQSTSAANIKNAGTFLNSLDTNEIEVFTLQAKNPDVNPAVSVPMLDLFTEKRIRYYYDASSALPSSEVEKSPLRFTWEYKNPKYYSGKGVDSEKAIVIISDDLEGTLPIHVEQEIKGYHHVKVFKTLEGIFQYRTIVTVYYN